jgi:hypothetical protein
LGKIFTGNHRELCIKYMGLSCKIALKPIHWVCLLCYNVAIPSGNHTWPTWQRKVHHKIICGSSCNILWKLKLKTSLKPPMRLSCTQLSNFPTCFTIFTAISDCSFSICGWVSPLSTTNQWGSTRHYPNSRC